MKILIKSTCIIILLCVSLNVQAQIRIAFIGNSITEGYGLLNPTIECYPNQVYLKLKNKYDDDILLFNSGISGRTMFKKGDNPIWNDGLFKSCFDWAPNICYIMLGTNDSKSKNWDSCGQSNGFMKDYKAMIDTFRYKNPNTLFMVAYPPPAFADLLGIRDSIILNGVIPVVDSIVKYSGAVLVDLYHPLLDSVYLFPDNIHPNAVGAKVIAKIIFDRIVGSDLIHKVNNTNTSIKVDKNDFGLVVFPNPLHNKACFKIFIQKPTQVIINIFDMKGRLLINNVQFLPATGIQIIEMDTSDLSEGLYLFEVSISGEVFSGKIIKD
jgi:acyl-CoA thioesterase I